MDWLKWIPSEIDSGWATLVAATIGIFIVAWQARLGFQSVVRAQQAQARLDREARAEQAKLDREAREHQAEIARSVEGENNKKKLVVVSAALSGELSAASTIFSNSLAVLRIQKVVMESVGNIVPSFNYNPLENFPKFKTKIFDANIENLGVLGPSTASDVVQVYQIFSISENAKPVDKLTGKITRSR